MDPVSVGILATRVSFQWALSCCALECVHSSLFLIAFDFILYCCFRVNLKFCFKHSVIFISLRSHYHETVNSQEEAVGSRGGGRYLPPPEAEIGALGKGNSLNIPHLFFRFYVAVVLTLYSLFCFCYCVCMLGT